MKNYILKLAIIFFSIFSPFIVMAESYHASLAHMPVYAVSNKEGLLVELVEAIDKITEDKITIGVYPFARSMYNVINGNADFHMPLIKNDIIPEEKLPYMYSAATIFHVNFILHTRKGSGVTLNNLSNHIIETDRAHVEYFPFKIIPSSSIKGSLEKLSLGRIDGYIFADKATDPILESLSLKNIKRQIYKIFEVKIILPKNEHGKEVDTMLLDAITKLRKTGEIQHIEDALNHPFIKNLKYK